MNSEAYRKPRWLRNFTHGPWETIIKCISGSGLKIACAVLIFKRNVVYICSYVVISCAPIMVGGSLHVLRKEGEEN